MIRISKNSPETHAETGRKLHYSDLTRRDFLYRSAAMASCVGAATLGPGPALAMPSSEPSEALAAVPELKILGVVQDHLLPAAAGVPGAVDVNATRYLAWVLADPDFDTDIKRLILVGARRLEQDSRAATDQGFVSLSHDAQAGMLKTTASRGRGEHWLATVLTYTLEALLCDPVYGGNLEQAGWKWLGHQPGFPRPPMNKRYGKL